MSGDETLTTELEDSDEHPRRDWSDLDLARLLTPAAGRHVAGIAIASMALLWPERTGVVIGRLVGLTLVVFGSSAAWSALRSRPVKWLHSLIAAGAVGLGVVFVAVPAETETTVGRILGAVLVAKGSWDLLAPASRRRSDSGWRTASGSAFIAVGLATLAFPTTLLAFLTVVLATGWILVELISLSVILDPRRDHDAPNDDTATLVGRWFADRPKTVEDRRRLYGQLLYEGGRSQAKITRFATLMFFSSIIAAMGVIADSTAVVVGAMLIAPLMMPLMAMALSLVMGWPNRLGRSALVALGGILIAVGIGFAIGLADFTVVDTLTNSQIASRSNPTLLDLGIAVAAGAAGAYGLSRPDVSDSLPGVAIAIALVPPLSVIGVSYSQGDWESGNGALLLFLTNAVAILVVGGLMFLLLGVAPLSRAAENQYRVRTASATVVGATALILGALFLNGTSIATNVFEQRSAQQVVDDWVQPFPRHSTVEVNVSGDNVSVVLAGPVTERRPTAARLADQLSAELGREITVDLRIRLEAQDTSSG